MNDIKIAWDVDGTIRPRPDTTRKAILEVVGNHKILSQQELFYQQWDEISIEAKNTGRDVFELFLIRIGVSEEKSKHLASVIKTRRSSRIISPQPYPELIDVLKQIQSSNIIVSHNTGIDEWLRENNLSEYFCSVIQGVSSKSEYIKGYIYVGDTISDVRDFLVANPKSNLNMFLIGNINEERLRYLLNQMGEDISRVIRISKLTEILGYLKKI
ncbi:MAG: hypothetical protein QW465_01205 [Candidatus Anstonellales archaeon]